MLFNSLEFLAFFPLVTLGYFLARGRARVWLLLLASCWFYMAFVPYYILILGFTIAVDYYAGIAIESATGHRRRMFLLASLAANVGVLVFFKYYGFADQNLRALGALLGAPLRLPLLSIVLPIGLSFHTFQAMSYTIEVYRGAQRAERDPVIYSLYVMYYPQLVAGPIERPQNLLHQFREEHSFDVARVSAGLLRIAWGMFKKVVVADRLAVVADGVFNDGRAFSGYPLIAAALCFSLQIYFDFSGYSDIALGCAQVMGVTLMENFKTPYASGSVGEFWRRWHVSLSTWFRDYVYVPLGGSRVGKLRHWRNLAVVFLLSGLWHGASWTFVVWGALHASFVLAGELFAPARSAMLRALGLSRDGWPARIASVGWTFCLVTTAWIFFRASNFGVAFHFLRHGFDHFGSDLRALLHGQEPGLSIRALPRVALGVAVVALEVVAATRGGVVSAIRAMRPIPRYAVYFSLIYGTMLLGGGPASQQQFIYFQF